MAVRDDDYALTFSQREGLAPPPEALQIGALPAQFRNQVWLFIERAITGDSRYSSPFGQYTPYDESRWKRLWISYNVEVLNLPHDSPGVSDYPSARNWLRKLIVDGKHHETLSFLEHILRKSSASRPLVQAIEECFKFSPYTVQRLGAKVCIVATTSNEQKKFISKALHNVNQSAFAGATAHLATAAEKLNRGDYADSIDDSIHAVESAAKQLSGKPKATLTDALNFLQERNIHIHPALESALKKLYGYTNAEPGIRHALSGANSANVGIDEAIFMYSACVTFIDYLIAKQRKLKKCLNSKTD